jgi:hypothetical protein
VLFADFPFLTDGAVKQLTSFFFGTRSFFEVVAFVHVRFARVRFVLELFFVFETKFFSITRWRVEEHTFFVF